MFTRMIVLSTVTVVLFSCAAAPLKEERRVQQENKLLDRAADKGWIELKSVKSSKERRELVRRAIALSRSAMAPYYDRLIARSMLRREKVAAAKQQNTAAELPATAVQDDESNDPEFVFEFRDAPLEEVCYLVGAAAGMNILVTIDMPETVTVSFPGINARKGLQAILDRYGYTLLEADGIYTVEKKSAEPLTTRTFALKTGIKIDIGTQLQPLAGPGAQITMLPDNRAIIVSATSEGLSRVENYLKTLDRRPRQVVIEALVVEVARTNSHRHGVDFSANNIEMFSSVGSFDSNFLPQAAGAATTGAGNPFTFGILNAKNAIEFMLSADDGIDKLNILHSPFISTMTGRKATLEVIEKIPYINATTSIGATGASSSGTVTSSQTIEFEEIGVKLEVTPNIGDDDIIEIWVKPTIDELSGFLVGVPVIDTRSAETNLMVRNGETVVLGGLLRNSFRRMQSAIPLLSDIPLIGELFKKVETEDEKIELMIFLTPHIIGYGFDSDPGNNAQEIFLNQPKGYGNVKKVLNRKDLETMRLDDD